MTFASHRNHEKHVRPTDGVRGWYLPDHRAPSPQQPSPHPPLVHPGCRAVPRGLPDVVDALRRHTGRLLAARPNPRGIALPSMAPSGSRRRLWGGGLAGAGRRLFLPSRVLATIDRSHPVTSRASPQSQSQIAALPTRTSHLTWADRLPSSSNPFLGARSSTKPVSGLDIGRVGTVHLGRGLAVLVPTPEET